MPASEDDWYAQISDPKNFMDSAYWAARKQYKPESWVYIIPTQQLGVVEEVKASPDGPRIRVRGIGVVPVAELRPATEQEIQDKSAA